MFWLKKKKKKIFDYAPSEGLRQHAYHRNLGKLFMLFFDDIMIIGVFQLKISNCSGAQSSLSTALFFKTGRVELAMIKQIGF